MSADTVALSRTTRQRLKRFATRSGNRWIDTATPRPDGLFDVPVSPAVKDALGRARITADETDESVVSRLLRERNT